ncbi:hypothetical protein [Fontivita pretiosa]|uniref:hypothetical protein n=1 Tax=Fontivita pretiosa TaxID=2989684 RepID=UPI003D1643FB
MNSCVTAGISRGVNFRRCRAAVGLFQRRRVDRLVDLSQCIILLEQLPDLRIAEQLPVAAAVVRGQIAEHPHGLDAILQQRFGGLPTVAQLLRHPLIQRSSIHGRPGVIPPAGRQK